MTMGIAGMGGIGSSTAMRFHYGFNMRILATDARPLVKPMYVDVLREPAWLMEMVPQVDVLVSAVPLTRHTSLMFNEKVFRAMKKTAYFLSLSRGGVVDQPALVQALKEGWIAGAGLDVTTPEPLPSRCAALGLPQHGHDLPHFRLLAPAPHPPDGAHRRKRAPLRRGPAAAERGG